MRIRLGNSLVPAALMGALAAAPVAAADRFVARPGGVDGGNACLTSSNPCRTIGHAISQATSGHTINVLGKTTYHEDIRIESSIVLMTVTKNRSGVGKLFGPPNEINGGFSMGGMLTANLTNSIVWGNVVPTEDVGADLYMDDPGITLNQDHCDVGDPEIEEGTFNDLGGNVSVDPLLKGVALLATSPGINAGTCEGGPPTDFEGDPRPSGADCDIGADEFVL